MPCRTVSRCVFCPRSLRGSKFRKKYGAITDRREQEVWNFRNGLCAPLIQAQFSVFRIGEMHFDPNSTVTGTNEAVHQRKTGIPYASNSSLANQFWDGLWLVLHGLRHGEVVTRDSKFAIFLQILKIIRAVVRSICYKNRTTTFNTQTASRVQYGGKRLLTFQKVSAIRIEIYQSTHYWSAETLCYYRWWGSERQGKTEALIVKYKFEGCYFCNLLT